MPGHSFQSHGSLSVDGKMKVEKILSAVLEFMGVDVKIGSVHTRGMLWLGVTMWW